MRKRRLKSQRIGIHQTMADPTHEDLLWVILEAGQKGLRGTGLETAVAAAAVTMGTLTAAKLLLRLQNAGGLEFMGEAQAWELIEQVSDDLASAYYDVLAGDLEDAASIYGFRLKGERPHVHLVRNRKTFRWCPTTIEGTEPTPFPPGWIEQLPAHATKIMNRIVRDLARTRRAFLRNSKELAMGYVIAETVALVAAAKLHLSLWDNDKLAASFECLAEKVSEIEYKRWSADRS